MRAYDKERDFEAFFRLNLESGWAKDTKRERDALVHFIDSGRVLVAEAGGGVECYAATHAGSMRYLGSELPLSIAG